MAATVLAAISKDEHERAKFLSRRKFETDMTSNLLTVEERGRIEGRIEGIAEGETIKAFDIARKMLKRNRPIDEIIEDTGLSHAEVESLQNAD